MGKAKARYLMLLVSVAVCLSVASCSSRDSGESCTKTLEEFEEITTQYYNETVNDRPCEIADWECYLEQTITWLKSFEAYEVSQCADEELTSAVDEATEKMIEYLIVEEEYLMAHVDGDRDKRSELSRDLEFLFEASYLAVREALCFDYEGRTEEIDKQFNCFD